ncbi:zinc finger FYVE domain-containing protein 9 [Scaptodrosophila lebanonensis]|uniref:Zinc finger FYVE domain-containing protein n=1 Tax=Drosophila lebanonensis TaxID=7225 RepID=A0A6J2U5R8_DROLE|nr:zinc finger FYVE domain-containing protein 9 [Scaptodrosophila lebanonensis]
MDLVDIDQVLDNLELRVAEDEKQSRNAAAAAAALAAAPSVGAETRPLGDGASSSAGCSNVSNGVPKSFVGVSHVFNSLDDYRKDVKSLETVTNQNYNWQLSEAGNIIDGANDEDEADAKDDDDALNQEDINKYSEALEKQPKLQLTQDGEAIVSSSESLTTSSCSTFSSGPSPGNSEELTTPPQSEKPSALEVLPNVAGAKNEPRAVEDLAIGLSSISITNTSESQSILPCEVTASSALGKVLNELSAVTETELNTQSQLQQGKGLADTMPLDPTVNAKPQKQQQEVPPKRSQPITFCSTMDEISDTELDSMLQEIDIDDAQEELVPRRGPHEMIDDDDDGDSTSPATEEESVRILSEQETASAEQMNVDNFSQASTVEFADLRAQESTPVTVMGEDIASSFSSTESSLSGRKLEDDEGDEILATDALETQEQRPERPTTLDLNSCNTQMYVNAGQTPPGETIQSSDETVPPVEDVEPNSHEYQEQATASANTNDSPIYEAVGYSDPFANLGKVPPIWVPDNMATGCMQCQQKFTMIKRRHHCRACGKVLCSVCCSQRFRLEFANEPESRVCVQCYMILCERQDAQQVDSSGSGGGGGDESSENADALPPTPMRSPNPNNPMEYCSTIPPHRQVNATPGAPPPSVIVPVGVLKKNNDSSSNSSNSSGKKARKRKSVMFSDGIAPGSELAGAMEQQWSEAKQARRGHHSDRTNRSSANNKPPTPGTNEPRSIDTTTMGLMASLFRGSIPPTAAVATLAAAEAGHTNANAESRVASQNSPRRKAEPTRNRKLPNGDAQGCFIPYDEHGLPPICLPSREATNCDFEYKDVRNDAELLDRLQRETLKFIVKNNFFVLVKIINLSCCMNCWVLNFTTSGMHHVGNDEVIILLEIKIPQKGETLKEPPVPRDIFQHLYELYTEAEHARATVELDFSSPRNANFLGSREHGGFIFIRPTYQCLQGVIVPESPYLVAVLIHRHEVPWAKVLPLRLILRLGAQYRYYPCPLISVRNRESVYAEIAQTIINFLADFRNYSYTLPAVRGLYIHMEDRQTTIVIPRYRHSDVIKGIDNASDHILAFAGNFSKVADGHLVCMQNVNDDKAEMYSYSTQAINIQGQPRKVTGASFFVLNEALKTSSGLTGKCSIVEDGLMVQILPTKMEEVRNALRNQNDINIVCGPIGATEEQTEIVSIKWVDNEREINVGVKSPIDDKPMDGVANIRVHGTLNYSSTNYIIRLTDVFILKCDDWYATNAENFSDIARISEQLARSSAMALLPFLDLLAAAGISKIGLRATLDQENVCYEAGARGSKLPPLYMNALDNHLIPTLHGESSGVEDSIILELVFHILNS